MIRVRDLAIAYDGRAALAGVDLDVAEGRTTAVLGPSGCGKSTLLRAVVGLVRPDRGAISIDGEVLGPHNALAIRQRLGYMIQSGGLFPHLTARDNALLLSRHLRRDARAADQRLSELAALVHIEPALLGRYPAQLSGGQRQRVSLIRALMLDPRILLLDEPLGALDPLIRAELQADLRRVFAALGKTVLLVTHDLGEAGFLGHTLVLMRAGRIVQQGSLEELMAAPAESFVSDFVNAQRSPLDGMEER